MRPKPPDSLMVADILDMEVVGANGEDLGNPEAVIERNGELLLVVAEGGFLGLGESQTAVPLSRATLNLDEEIIQLSSLSAEEIEEAGNFEFNGEEEVDADREVPLR